MLPLCVRRERICKGIWPDAIEGDIIRQTLESHPKIGSTHT